MASSSSSSEGLSLSALLLRGLESASKAYDMPSVEAETQALLRRAFGDVSAVVSRVNALSLFSDNENLDDVSTKDLVYILAPYVLAEITGRIKTDGLEERMNRLHESQGHLRRFAKLVDDYEIISEEQKKVFVVTANVRQDPAKRRETKIAQFKRERDIRSRIEALRQKKGHAPTSATNDFELIMSVIPKATPSAGEDTDDDEHDDITRELTLALIQLIWTQALSQSESMNNELELLQNAPREVTTRGLPEDLTWRLDRPQMTGGPDGKGPLLDPQGKPLRPFTIVPSDRARLQAQVFQPDHRLPTMTIDEYLEEEKRRGNIISGGGPASQNAPTSSEQLAIDAEQDGTAFGEEKAEERRQKDEKWARFTDSNAKGSGNTMNRG